MRNPKFAGVYSRKTPGKKSGSGPFYFVWDIGGAHAIQELDKSFVPRGGAALLSPEQLRAGFRFEPGLLAAPVSTPDFRHLQNRAGARGASEAAELNDATLRELEKARKARQVENDLRSDFEKAMRALNRPRDRKGALAALERLARATDGIAPAHKHMFRDFGVALRKKSLPDLAMLYARRTLELAPNDDHAHFNMARILNILGMNEQARAHLDKAISLDSRETVYRRMLAWLDRESGRS